MVGLHHVLRTARAFGAARRFPSGDDPRVSDGLLFPVFRPKFPFTFEGSTVFTIGSCFARNIEAVLAPKGVNLPTMDFQVPPEEYPYRNNGVLNEYNPGTMNQRILHALSGKDFPEGTIVPTSDDKVADVLLPGGCQPVTYERAVQRRREIAEIYRRLASADLVIITLGFVEAWYDTDTQMYLNAIPPLRFAEKNKARYHFRRLDVFECVRLMEEAIEALTSAGPTVLLTVSPVPLQVSFVGKDCILANEFSKSVLRVTAERLAGRPKVEYFPSYEIVRSGGLGAFVEDHVHVKPEVVQRVTDYMLSAYRQQETNVPTAASAAE